MPNAPAAPLVELRDVRKSFGSNLVLDAINLSIAPEEVMEGLVIGLFSDPRATSSAS